MKKMLKAGSLAAVLMLAYPVMAAEAHPASTAAVWNNAYGGVDKAYDSKLLKLRDQIAPQFKTLQFKDSVTGKTMEYNLFFPKNYDKNKRYPLVQFIADASTVGKGVAAPLMQGYGGIIWATDESQTKNPCFVLVPAFKGPDWAVNDQWQTSDEVDIAYRLLNDTINTYNIDRNRVYTTGQSMGGMISFYLNAIHPDMFAASIFVGSQWDINMLAPLANKKFFYVVSAGDQKASNGMAQVGKMLTDKGVKYGETEFSARLPDAEKNQKIKQLIGQKHAINFVRFTPNTVVPAGNTGKGAPEHMYSFDYAYQLEGVRDWLFQQVKPEKNEQARAVFDKGVAAYEQGNYAQALPLFEQASAAGEMKAPRYLGLAYLNGYSVQADPQKAAAYFQQGAQRGDITSQYWLASLYEKGTGVAQSWPLAVKWYKISAQRGDHVAAPAMTALGRLYANGLGVTADQAAAQQWYRAAAAVGDKDAQAALDAWGKHL